MNSQILKAKKNHKRLLDRKNNLHVKTKISNIQNVKVIPKIDKLEPLYTNNISIKKIHIRGYWNWNIHNDICAICRNYIFEPSINSNNQESNSVVGSCNHAYHYECISKWIIKNKNCPLCNRKWAYKKKCNENKYNPNINTRHTMLSEDSNIGSSSESFPESTNYIIHSFLELDPDDIEFEESITND